MSLRPYLFAIALALSAPPAAALTLDRAPIAVLAREATAIVRGDVVASRSERDDRGAIVTRYDVRLSEAVQGPAELAHASHITVTLPGGVAGHYRTVVPGVPTLSPGDEVVLLLVVAGDGTWRPLGYALGVIFVDADGALHASDGELLPTRWPALRATILDAPPTPAQAPLRGRP